MLTQFAFRFYIHDCIRQLSDLVLQDYGREHEQALLFPSHPVACRCIDFLKAQQPSLQDSRTRILDIKITAEQDGKGLSSLSGLQLSVALFPDHLSKTAKAFWQHTGEGISSRQADYIRQHFQTHVVTNSSLLQPSQRSSKGPRRYQRESADKTSPKAPSKSKESKASSASTNGSEAEGQECVLHVEERYGRNLDLSLAPEAKIAVKRRIAGLLTANVELRKAIGIPGNPLTTRLPKGFSEEDVYLFPTGMSSIFTTHQVLLSARGPLRSICYG
jgi:cystathionine gamma-synthase